MTSDGGRSTQRRRQHDCRVEARVAREQRRPAEPAADDRDLVGRREDLRVHAGRDAREQARAGQATRRAGVAPRAPPASSIGERRRDEHDLGARPPRAAADAASARASSIGVALQAVLDDGDPHVRASSTSDCAAVPAPQG